MTAKPPPLSESTVRPGKITIRQYRKPFDTWWTLNDWRTVGGRCNYLQADTFQECLDHLREIEEREMDARVGSEVTA